ncbi:MAG: N-acetyltransferase [Planctomycetota bacterium]|nr:N-acetyltransferase [Planctomycetota bacterium]
MNQPFQIRVEAAADHDAITALNDLAFGQSGEGKVVGLLRKAGALRVSLVAVSGSEIVGHLALSDMTHSKNPGLVLGLGPMSVLPSWQKKGVGSALVQASLERAKSEDAVAIICLGHPNFYPRFGFEPASKHSITGDYEVPDNVFMAHVFGAEQQLGLSGHVHYHEAFKEC